MQRRQKMSDKYKAIIGIEMHCEVSMTKTKVFSNSKNAYLEEPNVNINAIDLGFPGILPIVNKEAVKKALIASIILNCQQPEYLYFESFFVHFSCASSPTIKRTTFLPNTLPIKNATALPKSIPARLKRED